MGTVVFICRFAITPIVCVILASLFVYVLGQTVGVL